ncbi:MAG: acetolactate synthase large subunit [Thermoleophilia bacterium]
MTGSRAADVFVRCLEAEGVRHVFGIPGEETLDLNRSLARSSIRFVPVRHEQGAAFVAGMYGRLTGRAGVCLGTLGPGALNLVTGVADAFLDRMPLVALTGQRPLDRMHKESHQYVDLIEVMRPITKWNARASEPEIIPEVVRKAFRVAESEKPGATHLELPEDVMAQPLDATALPRRTPPLSDPGEREIERAAELACTATAPLVLAGNGVLRAGAAPALREFARATGIPVAETFMAKGAIDRADPLALGTVGLQERDYALAGFDEADVVIAVGYDLVEHAPAHWNPRRDKSVVVIDSLPAEIDAYFTPAVELLGDLDHVLRRLAETCRSRREPRPPVPRSRLRDLVDRRLEAGRGDDAFPVAPPRALCELREALGPADVLVSDVGLHKLWIATMFAAHEPNTVLIANGLAAMGFALPGAIAAKLADPDRRVVAVCGDGGVLMNFQELETAMRLGTAFVTVVWEDRGFGSIACKQRERFAGAHFGTEFTNPDLVRLAESFGMPAWRCDSAPDFGPRLRHALGLDVPSLIVLPIDYSVDIAISDELASETVIRA